MTEEILINYAPVETRVALVENGVVQEIYIEREEQRGRVGGIFKGKVVRVLPGMQAAFVDIGLERAAFIHASDIWRPQQKESGRHDTTMKGEGGQDQLEKEIDKREGGIKGEADAKGEAEASSELNTLNDLVAPPKLPSAQINLDTDRPRSDSNKIKPDLSLSETSFLPPPLIQHLVKEGDSLVVQVVKDQIGTKGARLTTHLSIPSRYLVFMPYSTHIGISQRVEDEGERDRLRCIISNCLNDRLALENMASAGVIARTVADGADEEAIRSDLEFLFKLWRSITNRIETVSAVSVIHYDLPLSLRTVRDLMRPMVERLRIDSEACYSRAIQFVKEFMPSVESRIERYEGERPILDLYNAEEEIKKALGRQVQLKSGGYLVLDQTEAMTTIDVNTGGYVGHRNLEETIYKTNLEAAHAIVRQLRLRNLGGIIIIDFIDMQEEEHKRQVMRTFEKMLERDHAKTNITQVSELGLVEMTRKRTRESLQRLLCESCPTCQGRGFIKTAESICYEIYREILRDASTYQSETLLVIAGQPVVDRLLDEESANVADLEEFTGSTIRFQVETLYSQEQFDVVLL